jgi:hypothetical protein
MNTFDTGILHFLNQFAERSAFVDKLIADISANDLLKGVFIMAIFWWLWFREAPTKSRDRELILCGIISASVGLLVARTLAALLPFRERPMRDPALHFTVPFGVNQQGLLHWSSFPSDHAVCVFCPVDIHLFVIA